MPTIQGCLYRFTDCFLARDVGNERYSVGALACQFSRHSACRLWIDIHDHEFGALAREAAGDRAADAAATPGDDRDLVLNCGHDS